MPHLEVFEGPVPVVRMPMKLRWLFWLLIFFLWVVVTSFTGERVEVHDEMH
jgi:hypothetical protein